MHKGILIILDGYGEGKDDKFNAVKNAKTPTLHGLKNYSYAMLKTHGESVGLLKNDLGGSEVGHMTIGAGRIIPSTLTKINDDIKTKEFEKNKDFVRIRNNLEKYNSDLHLIGLMSDKNIHSNFNHCIEVIQLLKDSAKNIFIHFITDGRDAPVFDSEKYLKVLKNRIKNVKNCHILSVSGRDFAMDRDNRQERTDLAFKAMFLGENPISNIDQYLKDSHKSGIEDQYIVPACLPNKNFNGVKQNDCLFFFNFREDRLRQMVTRVGELNCLVATMAEVGAGKHLTLYKNKMVKNTLSEYLTEQKVKHVKISETTKYAHVTYFMNGGAEKPFAYEDRIHIPTIKTNDYSKTPKMQARAIAEQTIKSINNGYDAIIVNFSNADMLGHTGNYRATVKSLECVDKCVKKIIKIAKQSGYFVMITADHGNAEEMVDKNGNPQTAHTLNPVVCAVVDEKIELKKHGELKDVAPTFLELLGVEKNKHFIGKSLLTNRK